jgi:hypothetical protein
MQNWALPMAMIAGMMEIMPLFWDGQPEDMS